MDVVNEKIGIKSALDAAVFGVVLAVLPVTIAAPAVAISSAVLASPVVVVHKEAIEVATRESLALKLRACRFFRMFRAISCTDEIFVFTLGTSTATWRGMTGGGKIFKKVQESNQRHAAGGHLLKLLKNIIFAHETFPTFFGGDRKTESSSSLYLRQLRSAACCHCQS